MKNEDSHADGTCSEYRELSRRGFLARSGTVAAAAVAAVTAPSWVPRVSLAADVDASRDILVNVFLRGGNDSLNMVVPSGDSDYLKARPTLGVKGADLKPLDTFFGLCKPLWPLMPAYTAGHLLMVHATGSTDPTRSHFEAVKRMEYGNPNQPGSNIFTGWIARHLQTIKGLGGPIRAVAISGTLPKALAGGPSTLPIKDLTQFDLPGRASTRFDRRQLISESYEGYSEPLGSSALNTFATIDLLRKLNIGGYKPSNNAVYPGTAFGRGLKSAAALIKADAGVEAIEVDRGGWDTHSNQGTLDGRMLALLQDLAGAVSAFYLDLSTSHIDKFTMIIQSEFGRRVEENGSAGTDHGHGSCMMFMGGHIKGGRVLTKWPGLSVQNRYKGLDLDVTIDFRDLYAEIVKTRLGNSQLDVVFPKYTPVFQGITV